MATEQSNPLTQQELTVSVLGETYQFKIPSFRDEARIGSLARFLRAQDDPEHVGSAEGLDFNTFFKYEALATFPVLLQRATVTWPYSAGKDGKPVVDIDQFPDDAPIMEVYEAYLDALAMFRKSRTGGEEPAQSAVVDGKQNP